MHTNSNIKNSFFSKPFLHSLFIRQNKWHQHNVLIHTLKVTYHIIKNKKFKMISAGLLHDIGKPSTAFKKDNEDWKYGEWSFTDHEERSYELIKDISFISDYTKNLVRYHYLIRDMSKSKTKDPERYLKKKAIWDNLSHDFKKDLELFIQFDDAGKGNKRR